MAADPLGWNFWDVLDEVSRILGVQIWSEISLGGQWSEGRKLTWAPLQNAPIPLSLESETFQESVSECRVGLGRLVRFHPSGCKTGCLPASEGDGGDVVLRLQMMLEGDDGGDLAVVIGIPCWKEEIRWVAVASFGPKEILGGMIHEEKCLSQGDGRACDGQGVAGAPVMDEFQLKGMGCERGEEGCV